MFNRAKTNKNVLIVFSLIFLILLSAFVFLYSLFSSELSRQKINTEFYVYQTSIALTETYINGEELNFDSIPTILGFGLYNEEGFSLYKFGSAPEQLERRNDIFNTNQILMTNNSMTIARRLGLAGMMRHKYSKNLMQNKMRMQGLNLQQGNNQIKNKTLALSMTEPKYSWIEFDISESLITKKNTNLIFLTISISFIILIILSIFFLFRINRYKKRIQEHTHLVQLGEAAKILSHEIKNPLGIIRIQVGLLKKSLLAEYQRNLEIIDEETVRLSKLADQIRDFLQGESKRDTSILASKILKQCKDRYGDIIRIDENSVLKDFSLKVNLENLIIILDNLIRNAIESEGKEPPLMYFRNSGKLIFICIRDYGKGIKKEETNRLFELFYTTKVKGSGIGLALSQKYAQEMDGYLKYKKMEDVGSEFCLALPFKREKNG